MKVEGLEQGTKEWLQWRQSGITATEVSVIMGTSKWTTPAELLEKKVKNEAEEIPKNKYLEWGLRLEKPILDKTVELYKLKKPQFGNLYQNGIFLCSLDGEAENSDGVKFVLEAKTSQSSRDWTPIPANYYMQVQAQLMVTGYKAAVISLLEKGVNFTSELVKPDPNLHAQIQTICTQFWGKVLQKRQQNHV